MNILNSAMLFLYVNTHNPLLVLQAVMSSLLESRQLLFVVDTVYCIFCAVTEKAFHRIEVSFSFGEA